MKKFIGKVNDKEFTNEKDFIIEALACLAKDDGNYSISSSYTTSSVDALPDENKFVNVSDITPDIMEHRVPYSILDQLSEDNKDYLRLAIDEVVTTLLTNSTRISDEKEELETKMNLIQEEIAELDKQIKGIQDDCEYWEEVSNHISQSKDCACDKPCECACCDCKNECEQCEDVEDECNTLLDILLEGKDVSLGELNQLNTKSIAATFDEFLKKFNII